MLAAERPAGLAGLLAQSDIVPSAAAGVAALSVLLALLAGLGDFCADDAQAGAARRGHGRISALGLQLSARSCRVAKRSPAATRSIGSRSTFREMASRISAQLQTLQARTIELRRELVANVSHDLKTPIATLQGYVDTLLLKDTSLTAEDRRSYLAHRLAQLRAAGQAGGRPDRAGQAGCATRSRCSPNRSPIGELIQDIAQKFELQARAASRCASSSTFPSRLPFVVGRHRADRARAGESDRQRDDAYTRRRARAPGRNASKGTRPWSTSPTPAVGIAQEDLTQVFERFFRVNNAGLGQGRARRTRARHHQEHSRSAPQPAHGGQRARLGHGVPLHAAGCAAAARKAACGNCRMTMAGWLAGVLVADGGVRRLACLL